ncbi:MAG: T9SS type A sorting domain-containing protein [bacterium]|nr:T9SS type A sorting domain-containing protein [bacterium]
MMLDIINDLSVIWTDYFLSWSLLNVIFLTIILCILYILRNKDARLLYLISILGLIKLLIPPFFTITGPVEIISLNKLFAGLLIDTPKEMLSDGFSFYMPLISKKSILMLIWLSFFSLMFLFTVYKGFLLRKILKGAKKADIENLNFNDTLGKIPVLESRFDHSPMVIGFIKPRIILPYCWKTWSYGCKRSILAHEIAHIRNGDRWINIIRFMAEAVHFMNPLVWIIGRKLDQYREMACDDKAVELVRQPAEMYSRNLLDISRHLSKQNIAVTMTPLFEKTSKLVRRIKYQLNRQPDQRTGRLTNLSVFIIMSALILPFSFDYSGRSVIDVKLSRNGIEIKNNGFENIFPDTIIKSAGRRLKRSIVISSNRLQNKDNKEKDELDNTHTFSIDNSENVYFTVYNISGQRIRSHPERQYPAGKILYTFDGLDDKGKKVATGIYIVRMKAENNDAKNAKILIN